MSQTMTMTATEPSAIELGRMGGESDTTQTTPPMTTTPDDAPLHAQSEVERWNHPKGNIGRLVFAFLSLMIAGMNDAAVGALIPEVRHPTNSPYRTELTQNS